jgi:bifunctional oligoribonuclease and PAP phosphatase NrnA
MTDPIDQILETIKSSQHFCLSGHQNPDADVVGSQLALASLIRRTGFDKQIDIINSGSPPKSLAFLNGFDRIENKEQVVGHYDCVVVFECSGPDRMGNIIDLKTQAKTVVNIDHHLHNPNFGHVNFVEPTTSSTAELIFKIYKRAGVTPTPQEAMCIFSGLVADTGWFRYGNTTPASLSAAAELLQAGVHVEELAERLYMTQSKAALDLLGWVVSHMTLHYDGRVALLTLPESVYQNFHAGPDDVEEIVNFGLKIESVCASVFLKEKKGQIKVSLRSKARYDINQVACHFGGGGHRNASGCTLMAPLQDAQKQVLQEMARVF